MKYSQNRVIPTDIPKAELEKSLEIIVDLFTEKWLEMKGNHPLQLLWQRYDFLSTNELFSFGYSLYSIKGDASKWIKGNINLIKNNNGKQKIGEIFEILVAAMLKNGGNTVIYPKLNNPGYDLTAMLEDNSKINISCKDYGVSVHNKSFKMQAKKFENQFLQICKVAGFKNINCTIISSVYPEIHDWKKLNSEMPYVLLEMQYKGLRSRFISFKRGIWEIGLCRNPETNYKLSTTHLSYVLNLTSPFHKNEKNRLDRKLDDACYNLSEKNITEDSNQINIIYVHLPVTASIDVCTKWGEEYLDNNKNKPVSALHFIKPAVTSNLDKKITTITYVCRLVKGDKYDKWSSNGLKREINLEFPVAGEFTDYDPEITFRDDNLEEHEINKLFSNNCYNYQKGELYADESRSLDKTIGLKAPGVQKYLVSKKGSKTVIKRPNMPPENELILI